MTGRLHLNLPLICETMDATDPVKYDFALFGLGCNGTLLNQINFQAYAFNDELVNEINSNLALQLTGKISMKRKLAMHCG